MGAYSKDRRRRGSNAVAPTATTNHVERIGWEAVSFHVQTERRFAQRFQTDGVQRHREQVSSKRSRIATKETVHTNICMILVDDTHIIRILH